MKDSVLIELIVSIKAGSRVSNELVCVHSGIYKQSVNPENLDIAKKTLVTALYNTATIIEEIGGEKN